MDKNKWNCKIFKVWDPEGGDVTGIESVDSEAHDGADANRSGIYTITGVRLQAPQKGLNIIKGKKVVIK